MAFELSKNVRVRRGPNGKVTQLLHLQQPYTSPQPAVMGVAPSQRDLADQYVRDVLPVYGLEEEVGAGLTSAPADRPTPAGMQLRFASEKDNAGNATVSYVQTYDGVPVWRSGFSVQIDQARAHVIGSQSSMLDELGPQRPPADAASLPNNLTAAKLAARLGLGQDAAQPKITRNRLYIYRYDSSQRLLAQENDPRQGRCAPPSPPNLPPVPATIQNGKDYFVTETFFEWDTPGSGLLNWQALIEVVSGAVLYLRPLISCLSSGMVYLVDPISKSGDPTHTPSAAAAVLDGFRDNVILDGLTPASAGQPQTLSGHFVRVVNVSPPATAAPTVIPPAAFAYTVNTDDFSAVNAYYHCDRVFRLVDHLGLNTNNYFNGTQFPVPVDHRATIGGNANTVNAQAPGNSLGNGSNGFRFALAQTGTNVGIANDWRVVLHEFGHAVLWDHVHSPNFGFAHSAGDSLAAILNDPGNNADRSRTFPWSSIITRRHDRTPATGWAWYGPQYDPFNPFGPDGSGYLAEEMLSSTLFRVYQAAGGDSALATEQRLAAHYVAFLILKAVSLLTPTSNADTPEDFADVLMLADTGSFLSDGVSHPCGVLPKVIRWSFEQQGAYQPAGAPVPAMTAGAPPDVDVYLNDGRNGAYQHVAAVAPPPDLWVRNAADGQSAHQTPIRNAINRVYVRVHNRGTTDAQNVRVRAFRATQLANPLWPTHWQPLTPASISAGADLAPGQELVLGPFDWTPNVGQESLMAFAEADGDLCNANRFGPTNPVATSRLAPADNNMARRDVTVP